MNFTDDFSLNECDNKLLKYVNEIGYFLIALFRDKKLTLLECRVLAIFYVVYGENNVYLKKTTSDELCEYLDTTPKSFSTVLSNLYRKKLLYRRAYSVYRIILNFSIELKEDFDFDVITIKNEKETITFAVNRTITNE